MKKIPFQFLLDFTSLTGVLLFVYWTRHGGLHDDVLSLFDRQATNDSSDDQVVHIGDIVFYYAVFATILAATVGLLKLVNARLREILPTVHNLMQLLLQIVQQIIIFVGIYVYLLHRNGFGLKNQHTILFPFWFLIATILHVLGKALTSVIPIKLDCSGAALYLKIATIGIMLAQISGYTPLKHF